MANTETKFQYSSIAVTLLFFSRDSFLRTVGSCLQHYGR
jgi:hypothetical protein